MTDAEPHSTSRILGRISKGYHVKIEGRWRRVETIEFAQRGGHRVIVTDSGSFPITAGSFLPSRDPAEQFYAVSAMLPTRQRVKPRGPLTNPFCGSRASGIVPTNVRKVYTA